MFSRFLADNVLMSTRWARNSPAKMRQRRARRDQIAATIINSMSQANYVSLLVEPVALDGKPLDFRTRKSGQYVIDILGTSFRVHKANAQPVYRLTALQGGLTLFVPV